MEILVNNDLGFLLINLNFRQGLINVIVIDIIEMILIFLFRDTYRSFNFN